MPEKTGDPGFSPLVDNQSAKAANPLGHSTFVSWVLATLIGLTIGNIIMIYIQREGLKTIGEQLMVFTLFGLAIGLPQVFALRLPVDDRFKWIVTAGLGWPVGVVVVGRCIVPTFLFFAWIIHGIEWNPGELGGTILMFTGRILSTATIIGEVQRRILRRFFRPTKLWVWANLVGWSMAGVAKVVLDNISGSDIVKGAIVGLAQGLLVGVTSGLVLARMRPRSEDAIERGRVGLVP